MKIILASSSIYKKELLSRLKIPFTTFSPDVDETRKEQEPVDDLVKRLAAEKALAVSEKYPNDICIGTDVVLDVNNEILCKPENFDTAIKQLSMMSGKTGRYCSGLSVVVKSQNFQQNSLVETFVKFKTLDQQTIQGYLEREQPYQSSGSFKSETSAIALTEKISSDDPSAVIGLPLIKLCEALDMLGFKIF